MPTQNPKIRPLTFSEAALFFGSGAGAGLIIFLLVGAAWQVSHFWWVLTGTTLFCGLIAVYARQDFEKTVNALMDSLPWI